MQAIANVAPQSKWKKAFQEAVFELNPTLLQPKLEAAQKAVEDRLGEVLSESGAVPRELMELEDALRTIRYLAKHELQT
jgi:hypothetical protein